MVKRAAKRSSIERHAKRVPSLRGHGGGAPIPAETRLTILTDAKAEILNGKTIEQIAAKHGISARSLNTWLSALGDEYTELRKAWVDAMLNDAGELLEGADDPLRLARARELWKRATWYAERRDRERYGNDQLSVHVTINDLGERLRRAQGRLIQAETVVALPQPDCVSDDANA